MVPQSFLFLQQEGFLIQSCLTQGLTDLRKASVSEKGKFYTASFHLSIGFERLMKVILTIDHMANNALATPTTTQLKQHGHNLTQLFDTLLTMPVASPPNPLSGIPRTSIACEILDLLSDFARTSRYFNLDSLSATQSQVDPLERWSNVFDRVLSDDVSENKKQRIVAQANKMGPVLAGQSYVFAHSLLGTPMDHAQMVAAPQLHDAAAPYVVYHLCSLIDPLQTLLSEVTDNARALSTTGAVPYMSEFFDWFWLDKPSILRKRKWP